jgi:hypothetical protein
MSLLALFSPLRRSLWGVLGLLGWLLLSLGPAQASHIAGADLYYRCLAE